MKAKKENKLGSAADGDCTDLNGIGDDGHNFGDNNYNVYDFNDNDYDEHNYHEHNFDCHDFDDNDYDQSSIIVIGDPGAYNKICRREFRHK